MLVEPYIRNDFRKRKENNMNLQIDSEYKLMHQLKKTFDSPITYNWLTKSAS